MNERKTCLLDIFNGYTRNVSMVILEESLLDVCEVFDCFRHCGPEDRTEYFSYNYRQFDPDRQRWVVNKMRVLFGVTNRAELINIVFPAIKTIKKEHWTYGFIPVKMLEKFIGLRYLELPQDFNKPIIFPPNLQTVKFGDLYNCPTNFPESVQKITFGYGYNSPTVIPKSLMSITLSRSLPNMKAVLAQLKNENVKVIYNECYFVDDEDVSDKNNIDFSDDDDTDDSDEHD